MSECFQQNAAVLGRRWPTVLSRLVAEEGEALQIEWVQGLDSTLRTGGIQLTSRHDRDAEARLQAAILTVESPLLHVYGTGLGDLQRVLLERPALERLHVHILNGGLFKRVLELLDQTAWLNDPRVALCYAADCPDIQLPFFALPGELELADGLNARIRDRLISEVHLSFNNRHFDPQAPEILQRLQDNLECVRGDADVAELFATQPGRDVYVIGTGPTLELHFEKLLALRAQSPRPLFISVDTAYRPLLEHGIKPDLVVTVDKNITLRHLPLEGSDDLPLVYVPMSNPSVVQGWRGKRYTAYSVSPIYAELRQQLSKAQLNVGGSVMHPAVDLAVKMGAAQITLFGADFAFPMNKTHAGWNDGDLGPGADLAKHWVLDGHGQRVKTQLNFRGYLAVLERYIAAHPQVRFLNSSRAGAMIAGTTYDPEFCQ
ncbi:DUF115 domain-containing protein [Pseudomonas sp. 10B1]|uniref:motility associated factor glycosyltransferase family protein n=1 Tax=unclassified Pseudomonas TaxID=196821 RepID=UPI002AB3F2F6|nr:MULTISPECIES: 6-hydroxymethylpterin diphosphokinase MptE-like protein [unclassified Pseudomonas]MDY7560756.1 DUF115 domain-containing protein [Pseudomonas sp. AB6]MEA9978124.1 DUF115 domain-containing protein [Pseudomonas sp. RTS4]MEA9997140.1 DUF115 domain-containing protein [Pseudomonas sp. AA4]MEB0087329.1 DUF115 domain-containing protein [Pseudomonas sp. RTI1]MEB0128116.1 DUF115 domain-containing protein [Pseudomonas sp. CCC1.2]